MSLRDGTPIPPEAGEGAGRRPKKAGGKAGTRRAGDQRTTGMVLSTPAHGGGKLRRGGPSPGSGRTPSRLKALALEGVETALPNIIAMSQQPTSEGVSAFNALLKTSGMDGRVSAADIRERLRQQVEMIRTLPTWDTDELIRHLSEVWK